jgi:uncharacterized protein CbrC (UPF0167 family)
VFTYFPDPFATGDFVPSTNECIVCGEAPGIIYAGSTAEVEEFDECICPWCIADGSAHRRLNASFVDRDGIGQHANGNWDAVPDSVAEEVAFRTPAFGGWQEERWYAHCGDAAVFLGYAGKLELSGVWAGALDGIRRDFGYRYYGETHWQKWFDALHADGREAAWSFRHWQDRTADATAYVFQCRHCGMLGGYLDFV